MPDTRCVVAARAAQELRDGEVINLGAGIPMLVADYLPDGHDVVIQTENGIVRAGPVAPGTEDPDRRNAGNLPVALLPGGCYIDSATSFGMIRGGHIDATMIGTLQVDGEGNIANYEMPGRKIGMGGAMDLVAGAKCVYVLTEHCVKDGASKLVKRCSLPSDRGIRVRRDHHGARPLSVAPGQRFSLGGGGARVDAGRYPCCHRNGLRGVRRRQTGACMGRSSRGAGRWWSSPTRRRRAWTSFTATTRTRFQEGEHRMKALVKTAAGPGLELVDVPLPRSGATKC